MPPGARLVVPKGLSSGVRRSFCHGGGSCGLPGWRLQRQVLARHPSLSRHAGLSLRSLASLVEVPCVTRNASAAVNAITAANMALAGIPAVIPMMKW